MRHIKKSTMTNKTTVLLAVSLFRTKEICHFFILFLSFGMARTTKQAETKRSRNRQRIDKVSKDDFDSKIRAHCKVINGKIYIPNFKNVFKDYSRQSIHAYAYRLFFPERVRYDFC